MYLKEKEVNEAIKQNEKQIGVIQRQIKMLEDKIKGKEYLIWYRNKKTRWPEQGARG